MTEDEECKLCLQRILEFIMNNPEVIEEWRQENVITFNTDFGSISMVKTPSWGL